MKIEKINDNQIRCTLTKEDLANRKLKLSELAYGTEKAKSLFRDMMQQAAYEFGFEANDIPLMIEAIPISAESIILIITKVEDPEELDTRFARFTPVEESDLDDVLPVASEPDGADDILDLFNKIREVKKKAMESAAAKAAKQTKQPEIQEPKAPETTEDESFNLTRLYRFYDLDTVIRVAGVLRGHYNGTNALYKDPETKAFYLIISKSDHTPEEFNKVCNILTEYSSGAKFKPATEAFYAEHMECVLAENALQKLGTL